MAFIVFHEKRPFSYKDFLKFEVDGNIYGRKHGTFRNKITKLRKKGEVERLYCSREINNDYSISYILHNALNF